MQQALAFHRVGRLPEAEALYRQILQTEPNHPEALHFLGLLAHQSGQSGIGVDLIGRAVRVRPDYVQAHFNMGKILFEQNRLDEAAGSFRRVLELSPDYAEAHNNLGIALYDMGRLNEAVACYQQALDLKPDSVQVHFNLGITLKDLGRLEKAAACFRQVLTAKPDYAEAHYNLGIILNEQGYPDEAAACYRQALTLKPDLAEALNNLGIILREQGRLEEAVACFRRAIVLKPGYPETHSNLLMCLNYLPRLSIVEYLNEARRFGRNAAKKVSKRFADWTCSTKPGRLRIGMVSGDLRNHPVGYFLENLLANIDSSQIELVAYPTQNHEDELTARIRPRFASWKPLTDLDDEAAAGLIHDHGVHILFDLAGHTRHNRLPVFAWKPAPVQVAWLGYFSSTGMAEIDYLLTDPISVPELHQAQFTEKVWYLPETRFCFSPPAVSADLMLSPLPALRNGYVIFGSFQSLSKINDQVLSAWGRIFQEMPQARLRLQNRQLSSPTVREQLLQRLTQNNIAPERVILEQSVPRVEYLAAHADIDIILDTFPFTGGTTTCEALWMGVPTLTLAGNTMVARQGAGMLTCASLADWIAENDADYVGKALTHAADLEKLARLRAGLREQLLASPLCDSTRFARNFEAALWGMWRSLEEKR
ncbi:MAG: tetratricopeptide repeat protein [Desulfobulbaceae bacterium]|nr:tetratricopeptide repeat protein [Desulfobulbaceae bacterium]